MATTAAAIKAAIETAIKGITPTLESGTPYVLASDDPGAVGEQGTPESSERLFEVWHQGGTSGPETGAGHYWTSTEYAVEERFRVLIQYPRREDLRALDNLIRSDIHDLKGALDDEASWESVNVIHQYVSSWDEPDRGNPREGRDAWIQTLIVTVRFVEAV